MLHCKLSNPGRSEKPEVVDLTEDADINNVANETITLDDSILKPEEVVTVSNSDSELDLNLDPNSNLDSDQYSDPYPDPYPEPELFPKQDSDSDLDIQELHTEPTSSMTQTLPLTKAQVRSLKRKEKEEEKVQKQANRLNTASKALENCITTIAKSIPDLVDDPEELSLHTLFDESCMQYKSTEYPSIEDSVTWTYKRTEVEHGECVQKYTCSNWILVFIKGSDYLRKILTYKNEPDNLQSIRHYLSDIRRRSKSDVILLVYGLDKHLKSERAKESRNYRRTFKDRFEGGKSSEQPDESSSSTLGVTELQDLRLMLEMEFKHEHPDWKLHIEFYEKTSDIVSSLVRYSVSIARRQVKQSAKASTGLDWALSMDKDKPSDPTKSSEHLTRLWISQLKQFSQVTVPIAKAIVADYPSPYALLDQYANLTTREAEDLLAELYAQKNLRRQIGSNISKRIHRFMTCKDPDVHIGL